MFGSAPTYQDRQDAGRRLAAALEHLRGTPGLLILGLARGGVPVAAEVARRFGAPLDVLVVRKLGAPFNPELALGALAADGEYLDPALISATRTTPTQLEVIRRRERAELRRREAAFRAGRPARPVAGCTAVIIDDGLATGATAIAALEAVRAGGARQVILAVPVASPEGLEAVRPHADAVVCLATPPGFRAVGEWYRSFSQTHDDEVLACLADADARLATVPVAGPSA